MSIPSYITVTVVAGLIGLIIELIHAFVIKEAFKGTIRIIGVTILFAFVGFVSEKIIEIDQNVREKEAYIKTHTSIHQGSITYLQALTSTANLPLSSTLRALLQDEIENLDERLRQIRNRELILKREDVIPKWEMLIKNSKKQVLATNIVTLEDWQKFSPTAGEEVHRMAIENGVEIKRIFIYSGTKKEKFKQLIEQAKIQKEWGVKTTLLEGQWLYESPFASDAVRDLGTKDIVIFDRECLLLTTVDENNRIMRSTLTTNTHRLQKALTLYDKLWREAEMQSKKIKNF